PLKRRAAPSKISAARPRSVFIVDLPCRLWNAKLLTDPDQVGILQDIAIRLEDLRVETRIAVVLLRDLAQGLPLLDHVPLGRVPLVGAARLLRFVCHRNAPSSASLPCSRIGMTSRRERQASGRVGLSNGIKGGAPQ